MINDNFMSDFESYLKQIATDLQNHALSQSQLNHTLLMLQQQLNIQKNLIDSSNQVLNNEAKDVLKNIRELADYLVPEIKTIEDIPVSKHPMWYMIESTEFEPSLEKTVKIDYVNINPEGPFVISSVMPYFVPTKALDFDSFSTSGFSNVLLSGGGLADPPLGRVLPCTSFPMIVENLGRANTTFFGYTTPSLYQLNYNMYPFYTDANSYINGPLADIPEFEFQIEIGGSGRFWTNRYIPAAAFYGTQGNPGYLGCLGWVDRADRLILHTRNLKPMSYTGKVLFVFHGYQMVGHVDIAKALGY